MAQTSFIENLLNLLWLLLALASVILWRRRWSVEEREKRGKQARRSMLALGCVLLLLFFVISLTDDLQEAPALVEYAGSFSRVLQNSKSALASFDSGKKSPWFIVFLDLATLTSLLAAFLGLVVLAGAPTPRSTLRRPVQGRAPPG